MFHILTTMLILGPRGDSDGLQNAVGLGRDPEIWTISQEMIMTTIAAVTELQPADPHRPQDAKDDQGYDTPLNNDISMERILGKMNATPQEEVLKRITSLRDIRRGKVLRIHRHVMDGTYQVADRLDEVIDRVLEAITT